jgi:hypothetical protein
LQVQVCRIVETANNQSATAEGLFFQLIVRVHKSSLGRANFEESVHWQHGLVLEDGTGARAFWEHVGNDVRITVRSPYPARFLAALTYEVKWLVEDFWRGMRCEVTVPCLALVSLAFCFAVEFSQLYHAPWIDSIRHTRRMVARISTQRNPRNISSAQRVSPPYLCQNGETGLAVERHQSPTAMTAAIATTQR